MNLEENRFIFVLPQEIFDYLKIQVKFINPEVKSRIIQLILDFIENLKQKYNAFSYFHLKAIISDNNLLTDIECRLVNLIKKYPQNIHKDYGKFLFCLILDSLDSISGGSIAQIERKYKTRMSTYKGFIFKDKQDYSSRFRIYQRDNIMKIADGILENIIDEKFFRNLQDPYIQVLKEYYRENFYLDYYQRRKSIFLNETVKKPFLHKFLELSQVSLKKIFLSANLEDINIFRLTKQMENINMNNEIQIFIIYNLLMKTAINPSEIAKISGVTRRIVRHYTRDLSKLINPKSNLPYIDYEKRFRPREKNPYYMLRKSKRSPTGYVLQMPKEIREEIFQEINKIITLLLQDYEYPYFIKEFLKNSSQRSADYNWITDKLVKLSKIHLNLTYSICFDLFYIILEFNDYITAKSQTDISKEFMRYKSFIKRLAKLVLKDPKIYRNRFPSSKFINEEMLDIAEGIIGNRVSFQDFSNIDSFEFQQLIKAYRYEVITAEKDLLIQKGYPSVGSQKFKRRIKGLKHKNLFDRYFLGVKFIEWIEHLTDLELENIIKFKTLSNLRKDILIICNNVNQNYEIIKYLIYLILKSNDSLNKIGRKTGKSPTTISSIAKLLDHNICPITNSFYLRSYEERFPRT